MAGSVRIIRWERFKDYYKNGFYGGFILGLIFFLFSIPTRTVSSSVGAGIAIWIGILIIFCGLGFFSEEYFIRRTKLKKLLSNKYQYLHDKGFTIHEELYFEGTMNGFFIRVLPMEQWRKNKKPIEYVILDTLCELPEGDVISPPINGLYNAGQISHINSRLSLFPKDHLNPNLEEDISALVSIAVRERLVPVSKQYWEDKYKPVFQIEEDADLKERTKVILKIGKFEIKYKKPEKLNN